MLYIHYVFASAAMMRKALKDVTLHDGTLLPKGVLVSVAAEPAHYDGNNYPDAATFDPFRFSRMRESEDESTKHQFVMTSAERAQTKTRHYFRCERDYCEDSEFEIRGAERRC